MLWSSPGGKASHHMAPDTWLTIVFAVLTVAGYLLWVLEARRGLRLLLTVLAIVSFALAVVFYEYVDTTVPDAGLGSAATMDIGSA